MSIIRNTASGLQRGRVGNTTFYVAKGQQVARQSRNNSNYGVDASRTRAQQERRVVWSNLVNVYKACKFWMPKAFESRKRNQSDYNRFMSVNIGISGIPLTKDEALNGCAVMAGYMVSQGSLAPIAYTSSAQGQNVTTDIAIGNITLTSATIAEVSAAIIANNPEFLAGDNIALVLFKTTPDSRQYPYTSCVYREFTLDLTNDQPFPTSQIYEFVSTSGTVLQVKSSVFGLDLYQCVALIHTRKVAGQLQTSTQYAYPNLTDFWDIYSTQRRMEEAIQSYGVAEDVPLDPSFSQGRINSVSINGVVSPYISGSIIQHSGSASIVISGSNLNERNLYLEHDGIRYTPLVKEDGSWTYLLGENGVNRIYINGLLFGGIEISGVVRPSELTDFYELYHYPTDTWTWEAQLANKTFRNESANWPVMATAEANGFLVMINDTDELNEDDFESVNGVIYDVYYHQSKNQMQIKIVASTTNSPTYLKYKGYIIAIFNYHN